MNISSIVQFFEKSVDQYPDKIALVFKEESVTYSELNQKAEKLSNVILKISPDEKIIGISTTRCTDMIMGVLAILKAGKTYMPIDPTYPSERHKNMVEISGLKYVVSGEGEEAVWSDLGLARIDFQAEENLRPEGDFSPGELYAVFFTSGSTGKPKGVMVKHEGAIELIEHKLTSSRAAGLGVKTLQFCHLGFDVSVKEIFVCLSSGGELHLVEDLQRLDAYFMLNYIQLHGINNVFFPFVALQYFTNAAVSSGIFPQSLTEVNTGGELLKITPQIREFFKKIPGAVLKNNYGPTEASIWASDINMQGHPDSWKEIPSIGKPLANCGFWILDEQLNQVPVGQLGELHISGPCLAKGYLNREDLTNARFIPWTTPEGKTITLYKTGDLVNQDEEGFYYFNGREDDQIKIRGNRVELGEIESSLANMPNVKHAIVKLDEDEMGQKYLCGYVQFMDKDKGDLSKIKSDLKSKIPEYMIPDYIIEVDYFPKTSSGKVDKKGLPKPRHTRPEWAAQLVSPSTTVENQLTDLFKEILNYDSISIHDNFFELGGNSLKGQRTIAELKQRFGLDLPIIKLYQFPTVFQIARFLEKEGKPKFLNLGTKSPKNEEQDVAVIGMALKFPGADSVERLLEILRNGEETISFFSQEELDISIPEEIRKNPDYVKARGIIEGYDEFDANFFGFNPKLASISDPQQRKFFEVAHEVLEKTGYRTQDGQLPIGVYAGCSNNTYFTHNLFNHSKLLEAYGDFMVGSLNEKDYLASRTAYHLNLTGPAVSVYSACSTALLAISQAADAIRTGKCNMAIAGGSSVKSPTKSGHIFEDGSVLTRDGHVNSFDASATGTVFSDGVGVVLLKNLKQAKADGDEILAVVKGFGVNNDGGEKGSFSAPSAEGQAGAIYAAIQDAGVHPDDIAYLEAHATATPIGDPIEVEGLKLAFDEASKKQYCAIGSIKSNIGHLNAAAGIAGFFRALLSLKHRQFFPQRGFSEINPNIDFENSPFYVNTELKTWDSDKKRIAGISSFGVGGTNVHLILEEAPETNPKQNASDTYKYPAHLINWSAKSEDSLRLYASKLSEFIHKNPDTPLAEVAFNLQENRRHFPFRKSVVADSKEELMQKLGDFSGSILPIKEPDEYVFLFPGQGAQFLNMGKELYEHNQVFKDAVDSCADILATVMDKSILEIIYPDQEGEHADAMLKNTKYTQPAIFTIEYALSQLWISLGVKPIILCGHSIGEFVAAHLAGIFTLEDALKLVAIRGKMISELPLGSMLSVRCTEEEIKSMMPPNLSLAGVNGEKQCVVSGETHEIELFAVKLEASNIPAKILQTSHAFHSQMMDPMLNSFAAVVREIPRQKPRIPIISTVTGGFLSDWDAQSPEYWTDQLRKAVRFSDAVDTLFDLDIPLSFLEVGPGNVLTALCRQAKKGKGKEMYNSLMKNLKISDYRFFLQTVGSLWQKGRKIQWQNLYNQAIPNLELPTYAFKKDKIWMEPAQKAVSQEMPAGNTKISQVIENTFSINIQTPIQMDRKIKIKHQVIGVIQDTTGLSVPDEKASFLELGFDSLLLTQLAASLKKEFKTAITFRQLSETLSDLAALVEFLDQKLPEEAYREPAPAMSSEPEVPVKAAEQPQMQPIFQQQAPPVAQAYAMPNLQPQQFVYPLPAQQGINPQSNGVHSPMELFSRQLELMSQQIMMLTNGGGNGRMPLPMASVGATVSVAPTPVAPLDKVPKPHSHAPPADAPKTFGAMAKIEKVSTEVSPEQKQFLDNLIKRFNEKTKNSKAYTQKYRSRMADPRVVSGFKPNTKEITYSLVVDRSKGSKIWDIDGNEYLDVLNGFGAILFGHGPDYVQKAILDQLDKGFEIGPQHVLAGEVCELLCELTGHERAALCNTGSEAVMGALRMARTVTGRSLVVSFNNSYHGIFDEVIVRGSNNQKSYPAAAGIMPSSVENLLVLEYGTEESLEIIRERRDELAAVLVEPVQSRRPEFQPIEFLRKVREITKESGTALIFDEVITGFRTHLKGAQGIFGVKADIGTYGKVIGGGLPIGAIAGSAEFLDALDGGYWEFGDDSMPEVGVTYFAGTFVRHPLALASTKASLEFFKKDNGNLQQDLEQKTNRIADSLDKYFKEQNLPFYIAHFGSLWKLKYKQELPYTDLIFILLREKGIHIYDGFPCYLTTEIMEADVDRVIDSFKQSIGELLDVGFFGGIPKKANGLGHEKKHVVSWASPPVPGAKLGKDQQGNPAWFLLDDENPGKYLKINIEN